MATIVNSPTPTSDSSGGLGYIIAAIILAAVIILLFVYGLPLIRGGITSPQVNVPGTVDVNLNQGQGAK